MKQELLNLLQEATTARKVIMLFTIAPIIWIFPVSGYLIKEYHPFELYFLGSFAIGLCILYLFYFVIKRIIKARRKMRVSALKVYFYFYGLFLQNFVIVYLFYGEHVISSWCSFLITFSYSIGLCIIFVVRITSKYEE